MTGWELEDLMDVLQDANQGNTIALTTFLKEYKLASVDSRYTLLALLRRFQAVGTGNDRSVLNCAPDDENFQWGITVVICEEAGLCQSNFYIPNHSDYTQLKVYDDGSLFIQRPASGYTTNVWELNNKLFLKETEEEILEGFSSLCNEQEVKKEPIEAAPFIRSSTLGELPFNEQLEWYEGFMAIEGRQVSVSIHLASDMSTLVEEVDKRLKQPFFRTAVNGMVEEMVALKNEHWLEEGESPISKKEFLALVKLDSIVVYDDLSSVLYFSIPLFLGHGIAVNLDSQGKYDYCGLVG